MHIRLAAAAAATACLLAAPAAAQNLVTNGNFEANPAVLTGWTTGDRIWYQQSVDVIEGSRSAAANCIGASCIRDSNGDFWTGSNGGGSYLYQDLATVAGQSYTINFSYNSRGNEDSELAVLFGGTLLADFINVAAGANGYTRTGMATSATTRLLFLGRQDPRSIRLDSVSVVGPAAVGDVPEPATWGMMILGFGIVGAAARRRRTPSVVAY